MIDRFQDPFFLYLIVPGWLLVATLFWWMRRDLDQLRKRIGTAVFNKLTVGLSESRRIVKLLILAGFWTFLLLALARPQAANRKEKVRVQGIELVIVLDVSQSMLAEDLKPSRLILAKKELVRFIDLMGGNKMGLIPFAGSAFLMSPLTPDLSALKMFVESLGVESVSTQGTNFSKALEVAEEAFNRGGVGSDEVSRISRAIILVSDGEDHEPGALKRVQELRKSGIRTFTLAAGTEKGGPIPMRDGRGRLLGYKKDSKGDVITTVVNGKMLAELAQAGGGSFRYLRFGGTAVQDLVGELNQLQKSDFEESEIVDYAELYFFFLLVAIILLMVWLLINDAPSSQRAWGGRFL